jgi:peptidoglycan/xylan/chitin deacetylase (PgdA/CDA1 family)
MNSTNRFIALTFDDGPNDTHTPKLLDTLAQYGAKATFFLIGKHVRRFPEIARRIHSEGHAIGNHTFNHPALPGLTGAAVGKELVDCRRAIEDVIGCPTGLLFRPPFGEIDTTAIYVAASMCLVAVNWSVDAEDWTIKPAQKIVEMIAATIEGRAQDEIILLHDGSPDYPPADRDKCQGTTLAPSPR